MSSVLSISGRRRYGLARVCRVWGIARAGVYRGRRTANLSEAPRRRPGPQGPMPDAALVDEIRTVLNHSPFHGEGYRKVWARLRHKGVRTSKERVRRLMRENGLSADTGRATPRGPRNHDGTIIPDTVDIMWGTDMTTAVTTEHGQVAVFVAVDHCSAECVGIHAALRGTRHEALEPVRQGVTARFGATGKDVALGLSLRHDHGSQYMSHDFQTEIRWLGISSSPAGVPPLKFSNRTGQGFCFRSASSPGSGFSPQSIALGVAACWRRMVDRPKWSSRSSSVRLAEAPRFRGPA